VPRTGTADPSIANGGIFVPFQLRGSEKQLKRHEKELVNHSVTGLYESRIQHRSAAERAREEASEERRLRGTAEERARREAEERAAWEQLAIEADAAKAEFERRLADLQAEAEQLPAADTDVYMQFGSAAAAKIDLGEAETRTIIDQRLRTELRYSKGVRPVRGRNMAIAEWPTASGPADYALFVGTKCIGVVEGKRKRKNVSAAIDQAARYSKGIRLDREADTIGGPWGEYKVCSPRNGRPYLKHLETESGIWFRDVSKTTNHRRATNDWPTPEGLLGRLEIDREAAHERPHPL
jgi:type I restriction enzyme R subunit